jgi:hypothetical protein
MVEMVFRVPRFSLLTTEAMEMPLARASDAVSGSTELLVG